MRILRVMSWILGACTCVVGALVLWRAINPTLTGTLPVISTQAITPWLTFALAVVTVLIAAIARVVTMRQRRRSDPSRNHAFVITRTAGGTTMAVVGAGLAAVAMLLVSMYPSGVVGKTHDTAPFGDRQTAAAVIDESIGACSGTWINLGEADIKGITFGIVCPSDKTVYAEFGDDEQWQAFTSNLPQLTPPLMLSYASAEAITDESQYASLTGPRWVAITPVDSAEQLQQTIGGQLAVIN